MYSMVLSDGSEICKYSMVLSEGAEELCIFSTLLLEGLELGIPSELTCGVKVFPATGSKTLLLVEELAGDCTGEGS